jgi:hypothetical protein
VVERKPQPVAADVVFMPDHGDHSSAAARLAAARRPRDPAGMVGLRSSDSRARMVNSGARVMSFDNVTLEYPLAAYAAADRYPIPVT